MTRIPTAALTIRPATSADAPQLIALVNLAYSIETFLEGTRTDEARLAATMEKGVVLVAEDSSGDILACVSTELHPGEDGPRGYLGQLAVAPAHQGLGLARFIVSAGEEYLRAQGCRAVDIIVLNLRPELPPIYRRFGYVETGTQEFTPTRALKPGVHVHGIVMTKQLQSGS